MALDPTLSLKVVDPLDARAKAQQNTMRAIEINDAPRKIANDQMRMDMDVQRFDAEKRRTELADAMEKVEYQGKLLMAATPQNYAQVRMDAITKLGADPKSIPEVYDEGYIRQMGMATLDMKDRLKLEMDAVLNEAKIGTERAQAGSFNALANQRNAAAGLNNANAARVRATPAPVAVGPTTAMGAPVAAPAGAPAPQAAPAAQPFNFGNIADPLRGVTTEGQRSTTMRMVGTEAQKAIDEQAKLVAQESQVKASLAKFAAAQQRQGGAPNITQNIPGIAAAQRALDADVADMAQVQAEIAPTMRPPGSGATSDYDAKQFERATVGPDKPTETNNNIIKARTAAADLAEQKLQFLEAYRQQNGHVRGADAAWRKYVEANPIFDRRSGDAFKLNEGRKSWEQYFSGAPKSAETNSAEPQKKRLKYNPQTGNLE